MDTISYNDTVYENDVVIFDDFKLKVMKLYSDSDSSSSCPDVQTTFEYDNCDSILHALKDHALYVEYGYFDKLKFTDIEEYLGNIDEEDFSETFETNVTVVRKKPISFQSWVSVNLEVLNDSYGYLERITKMKQIRNNTFYRFCLLGFKTSTSASSSRLVS